MAAVPFPVFIGQSPVKTLFDPSSDGSHISQFSFTNLICRALSGAVDPVSPIPRLTVTWKMFSLRSWTILNTSTSDRRSVVDKGVCVPEGSADLVANKQLPRGKTVVSVFADFMGYLSDSTKMLFKTSEPNGEVRWDSVSDSVELVLTHSNGWGGPQQTKLRTAVGMVKVGFRLVDG